MGLLSSDDQGSGALPSSHAQYRDLRHRNRKLANLISFAMLGLVMVFSHFAYKYLFPHKQTRRDLIGLAGETLHLGAPAVELLKRLGGASCSNPEAPRSTQLVFHVRDGDAKGSGAGADPAEGASERPAGCVPDKGDLVVWTAERKILKFTPVEGASKVVEDAAGFARFQKRYRHFTGAPEGATQVPQ